MSDAPKPSLFRVTRDTLYHTAGTILSLTPDQVSPANHEPLELPVAQPEGMEQVRADIEDLKSGMAALGSHLDTLDAVMTKLPVEPSDDMRALLDGAVETIKGLGDRVTSLEAARANEPPLVADNPDAQALLDAEKAGEMPPIVPPPRLSSL